MFFPYRIERKIFMSKGDQQRHNSIAAVADIQKLFTAEERMKKEEEDEDETEEQKMPSYHSC